MKKFAIVLLLVLANLVTSTVFAQTKVLVLGSYHMGNPGLDAFNMTADDVLAAKRQGEIEEFTMLLSKFKPTKICLEYPIEKQAKLDSIYQAYVIGKFELRRNESDQIGLRLAKKLKLEKVYAIDTKAPFDMDTVVKVAQKFQFNDFMQKLGTIPSFMEAENKKLRESTITQFYQHLNSPSYINQAHELYLALARVGVNDNYAGADLVADWYKRNLRIYNNLTRLSIRPEDRVLILYGAGHTKILQDLIDDSAEFEIVALGELK
jgi:Family of unknown function (DUF5694)